MSSWKVLSVRKLTLDPSHQEGEPISLWDTGLLLNDHRLLSNETVCSVTSSAPSRNQRGPAALVRSPCHALGYPCSLGLQLFNV